MSSEVNMSIYVNVSKQYVQLMTSEPVQEFEKPNTFTVNVSDWDNVSLA